MVQTGVWLPGSAVKVAALLVSPMFVLRTVRAARTERPPVIVDGSGEGALAVAEQLGDGRVPVLLPGLEEAEVVRTQPGGEGSHERFLWHALSGVPA